MPSKSIPITLKDGKEYNLRYDWEALEKLEQIIGQSLPELGASMLMGKVGFSQTSRIIWAGLIWENKELTTADLVARLDVSKLDYYIEKIAECLESTFPESEKTEEANKTEDEKKEKGPSLTIPGRDSLKKATT